MRLYPAHTGTLITSRILRVLLGQAIILSLEYWQHVCVLVYTSLLQQRRDVVMTYYCTCSSCAVVNISCGNLPITPAFRTFFRLMRKNPPPASSCRWCWSCVYRRLKASKTSRNVHSGDASRRWFFLRFRVKNLFAVAIYHLVKVFNTNRPTKYQLLYLNTG